LSTRWFDEAPRLTGATPFRFDGARPVRLDPAPTMGRHTDEILAELDAFNRVMEGAAREPSALRAP
jgi:crotonobetainyl-CoA:carnitine CoA-transferase CaiB-like acyl-CoA transferase